jgi:hypothetical protein
MKKLMTYYVYVTTGCNFEVMGGRALLFLGKKFGLKTRQPWVNRPPPSFIYEGPPF